MDSPICADPAGRNCIDCRLAYELAFWANHFGVTRDEPIEVTAGVRPRISDVTAEFARRK